MTGAHISAYEFVMQASHNAWRSSEPKQRLGRVVEHAQECQP